jgi:hypothetical protein
MCACLNQALAARGQGPIGLLGPKLYPLAGTPAIYAVTKGYFEEYAGMEIGPIGAPTAIVSNGPSTNGAYAVGPNYDCITGLGTPNVARLVDALSAASSAPFVRSQPSAQSVNAGAYLTLMVDAGGGGLSYQWALNGSAVTGATNAALFFPAVAAHQAGNYSCTVTNHFGAVSTSAAAVTVASSAKLNNISARANVGAGNNALIAGFYVGADSQSVPKNILVRCMGPSLGQPPFNVPGALSATSMSFHDANSLLETVRGWGPGTSLQSSGSATSCTFSPASAAFMLSLYAFTPYTAGSADSALVATLPLNTTQGYTSVCSGVNGSTGVGLVEVYDADLAAGVANNTAHLINLSARANAGSGSNVLTAGFWITGTTSETVLLRGVGPGLTSQGVSGALQNPAITLYDSDSVPIASNTGWLNAPTFQTWVSQGGAANPTNGSGVSNLTAPWNMQVGLEAATNALMESVYAATLAPGDSAMIVTLPPGGYTVEISGANGSMGVALAEIYEVK